MEMPRTRRRRFSLLRFVLAGGVLLLVGFAVLAAVLRIANRAGSDSATQFWELGYSQSAEEAKELADAWLREHRPEHWARHNKHPRENDSTVQASQPRSEQILDLADLVEFVEPSVVRINTRQGGRRGTGSGFIVKPSGVVVTNYHVVAQAHSASVLFSDNRSSQVSGYLNLDRDKDLAVLQVEWRHEDLPVLKLSDKVPRKGERAIAFGAPLGLSFSTSEGIVSGIRSPLELLHTNLRLNVSWIQTTAPISPGNSGGPLVNMRGEVIGVNTAASTQGAQNLNFAISAEDVRKVLRKSADFPVPLSRNSRNP